MPRFLDLLRWRFPRAAWLLRALRQAFSARPDPADFYRSSHLYRRRASVATAPAARAPAALAARGELLHARRLQAPRADA